MEETTFPSGKATFIAFISRKIFSAGRGGKKSSWEGGIRVPAFIFSPLLPDSVHGQVNEWLATVLENCSSTNQAVIVGKICFLVCST